jgi:hypothetical protein
MYLKLSLILQTNFMELIKVATNSNFKLIELITSQSRIINSGRTLERVVFWRFEACLKTTFDEVYKPLLLYSSVLYKFKGKTRR